MLVDFQYTGLFVAQLLFFNLKISKSAFLIFPKFFPDIYLLTYSMYLLPMMLGVCALGMPFLHLIMQGGVQLFKTGKLNVMGKFSCFKYRYRVPTCLEFMQLFSISVRKAPFIFYDSQSKSNSSRNLLRLLTLCSPKFHIFCISGADSKEGARSLLR